MEVEGARRWEQELGKIPIQVHRENHAGLHRSVEPDSLVR